MYTKKIDIIYSKVLVMGVQFIETPSLVEMGQRSN